VPNEVVCLVRHNGRAAEGKAKRETYELIFRSPELRLRIPFAQTAPAVEDDDLVLRWPEGETRLEIGATEAAKWAKAIANPPTLLDKLGLRAGQQVLVENVERGFLGEMAVTEGEPADLIFYGAEQTADLARLHDLKQKIKPNGAIWVVSPRRQVKEADVYAAGHAAGLVDVKVAAFSPTHTANKFVIRLADRPRP
jgi:hypothetical protein